MRKAWKELLPEKSCWAAIEKDNLLLGASGSSGRGSFRYLCSWVPDSGSGC